MRVGTQNFLIGLDTFFDYIPIFSTITNLVDTIIRELVLSHKTSAEINDNRYYKHLVSKDDDWTTFIPFVGNGIFVYHRYFEDTVISTTPKDTLDRQKRMLAAIKEDNNAITRAGKLVENKDFMLQVVDINSLLLGYAPAELRQDKELAKRAVSQNVEALKYVGTVLLTDKDFMLDLVRMNGLALRYCYLTGEARKEIERAAIQQNPEAKQYAIYQSIEVIDEAIEPVSDEARAIESFKRSPHSIHWIGTEAIRNKIVILLFTNQLTGIGERHRLYAANHAIINQEHFSDEILKTAASICIHNPQNSAFANDAPLESVTYLLEAINVPEEDLLQAASLCMTRYSSDEELLATGVSILDNWLLLHADDQENDRLNAIAKVVANHPQDLFSPGVKQKAIQIAFWNDKSRFCSNENEYKIQISTALIKKEPEKVLKKLYQNCFIPNPMTQGLYLIQLNDHTLERQPEVIDQAGVARTFLTDLFEALKKQAESADYKLLKFENTPGGALPTASSHTKEGRYKRMPPHMVSKLTEAELQEAADLAYPNRAHHDLSQIRAKFDVVQRTIDPLSDEEQKLYMLIGKLMALCNTSNSKYIIGQIFDPVLYEVLSAIPTNELPNAYEELNVHTLLTLYKALNPDERRFSYLAIDNPHELTQDVTDELLLYAYPDSDERPAVLQGNPSLRTIQTYFFQIQQDVKTALLEEARQHATLKAIFMIAKGLASHTTSNSRIWPSLNWLEPILMIERIQGRFSAELVKNAILCNNPKIKGYFTRWIDENSDDSNKLQDFLYVVTGSRSLATGSHLKVENNLASQAHLLQFHTCFRSIDAYEYPSYDLFKQRLEKSVQEALASGFQRM